MVARICFDQWRSEAIESIAKSLSDCNNHSMKAYGINYKSQEEIVCHLEKLIKVLENRDE